MIAGHFYHRKCKFNLLETVRTRLRRLQATDFENMRLLDSDPAVMRYTPSRIPQSEEQTRERIKSQIERQKSFDPFGIWLAEDKQTSDFLGWFMLIPTQDNELEIGFMLAQSQWGRGFATEICQQLIEFAKGKGISQLTARTSLENTVSMRVLEKLGFRHTKNIFVNEKGLEGRVELRLYEMQFG